MPLRNFSDGQEVVMDDFNASSKAILREIYDRLAYEVLQRKENAFFSDSLKVSYSNANTVIVKKGLGFQTKAVAVSPEVKRQPIVLLEDQSLNISAPHATLDRIDIVCVKSAVIDELTGQRNYKDASDGSVSLENFTIQKDWSSELSVVVGVAAGPPVAPATPDGYIKIAEVLVTAVTGLSGSGAITDTRTLMPVGSDITLNTTGYQRLPSNAASTLISLFAAIDSYLKNGHFEYFDVDDLGADPAAPSAGKVRLYSKSGVRYVRNSAGVVTPIGSGGGGGGGGANWQPVAGAGPVDFYEYNEKVWLFSQGIDQKLELWLKVPSSYIAGTQIKLKCLVYSPGAADEFNFQATSTLIRKNNDAIDSTALQEVNDSGDLTNTVAKQMREIQINLSTELGVIGGEAIAAGDLIKVQIERIAPAGVDDTNDLRFIPSSTEVLF